MNRIRSLVVLAALLAAGCSTVRPYTADIAKESPRFGQLTTAEAAAVIKAQASVSGETADYGTFAVDEKGFSFKKTTEETTTEWKGNKPHEVKSTHWTTHDVPWAAVTGVTPYEEEYTFPFRHIRYRVRLDYGISTLTPGGREDESVDLVLDCRTHASLADVMAALKTLTER